MAVWKEIRCDENVSQECADVLNNNPMGFDHAAALRREGSRIGWRRENGRDICPDCAKALDQ